jgi:hypothetical protein
METKTYAGAWVTIAFQDIDPHPAVYISFGEYDPNAEINQDGDEGVDSFGVPDSQVFYYCSKEELESILNKEMWDWKLLSIDELVTAE